MNQLYNKQREHRQKQLAKANRWKQEVEMGRKQNQEFVQIPHARFIDLLTYKAALVGIRVILTEESYTIARKVVPTAFDGLGVAAPAVRPRPLAV